MAKISLEVGKRNVIRLIARLGMLTIVIALLYVVMFALVDSVCLSGGRWRVLVLPF